MVVEPRRRRARLERVGKDADALETRRFDEVEQFLELRLGLAGEADDERRPQRQVGDRRAQLAEQVLGRGAVDAPLHALQHAVVDVLQRHVEVRDDLLRARQRLDQLRR